MRRPGSQGVGRFLCVVIGYVDRGRFGSYDVFLVRKMGCLVYEICLMSRYR